MITMMFLIIDCSNSYSEKIMLGINGQWLLIKRVLKLRKQQ